MTKYITTLLVIVVAYTANAQVIIGNDTGTATDKTSVLLDFAAGENKGIILPAVRTIPTGTGLVEGTIILDASDETKAKVKYYNGSWKDLSNGNEANISTIMANQPNITEDTAKGAIIGANTSTADGVLILESTDKAMVLPQVNNTDDVINPAPGMMVYINKPGAKRLAVFNGAKWSYWKP
ncbi:hypothetical protein [Chryseobacterium oryctis]|uniref:Uncharacterized protein n=1 Tax=Chryseobacterium oryctis TaxID=2952618 RepID=A0ABT3HNH4_9FLAO|nr:hypothetical protein [Chryseobacterium oryctis]MCW3161322.1 hypothetical protein [Chryseobacterium oryctis]